MTERNPRQKRVERSPWYAWRWLAAGLILAYILLYMPTSMVIFTAGSAEPVKPMVEIANGGSQQEDGVFMLTTVRRTNANLLLLAWNAFNDDAEFAKKEDSLAGRTEEEYMTELVFSMSGSQSNAILAAYNYAEVPYSQQANGVYVIRNMDGIANNEFQTNDRIVKIDKTDIKGITDLRRAIENRKSGDELTVTVERKGKTMEAKATLVEFATTAEPDQKQVGFGTYYGEKVDIVPDDPQYKITFKESEIGGPSAGLMFTLELLNQLTPDDLTKGQRIAGTGTITPDGTVGKIGGVQHKVVAADREGAVLFLVPEENYEEAKAKMDQMDTKMQLVSVNSLSDAMVALKQLDEAQP